MDFHSTNIGKVIFIEINNDFYQLPLVPPVFTGFLVAPDDFVEVAFAINLEFPPAKINSPSALI